MSDSFGSGDFRYQYVEGWAKLPQGMSFYECPDVSVDSQDNVYILTRGEAPIIVLDREGNFVRSFGEGMFSQSHGLYLADDGSTLVADLATHTIQKLDPEGRKLLEIGERERPTPRWSGGPFNRPTQAAILPSNGDIYISDGYSNSRIHVYTSSGEYKFSWGSPGVDAGQFICPHNILVDSNERIYVADRECHRVQVFDAEGNFITMWNNIHRPNGMVLWQDHIYVAECPGFLEVGDDAPGVGNRISIYDLNGKMVCRFGDLEYGQEEGQFVAPHGIAVDSRGDVYVSEVPYTYRSAVRGSKMDMSVPLPAMSKYARQP